MFVGVFGLIEVCELVYCLEFVVIVGSVDVVGVREFVGYVDFVDGVGFYLFGCYEVRYFGVGDCGEVVFLEWVFGF